MNNFEYLLARAQAGDMESTLSILDMYKPMLTRLSRIFGTFDEDLYQELTITLLRCIVQFKIS